MERKTREKIKTKIKEWKISQDEREKIREEENSQSKSGSKQKRKKNYQSRIGRKQKKHVERSLDQTISEKYRIVTK